jgi:hypothetical protein
MVTIEPAKDKDWLRITVKAPFSGTRDALKRENLLERLQLVGGTDKETTLNWPLEGILNHVVKLLVRVEQVAANCSDFGDTCRNCGYVDDCRDKIAGRR